MLLASMLRAPSRCQRYWRPAVDTSHADIVRHPTVEPMKGRALPAVVTALTVALLTGCATTTIGEPEPAPTTASPVFASDEEALAAAQAAYERYSEASDQVVSSGTGDVAPLSELVTPEQLERERSEIETLVRSQRRIEGKAELASFALQDYQLDGSATAYVCLDVSGTRVVDASGRDVTPPDRRPGQPLLVRFEFTEGELLLSGSEVWQSGDFC